MKLGFLLRTALLLAVASLSASAASIELLSSGGDSYLYGLQLDVGESLTFNFGDYVRFSGLSRVTKAATTFFRNSCFSPSVAGADVTYTQEQFASCSYANLLFAAEIFDIRSSSTRTGPIEYTVQVRGTTLTGTLTGPIADGPDDPSQAPEPATFAVVAVSLLGTLSKSLWRRNSSGACCVPSLRT